MTYSIVGRDRDAGHIGGAVQTAAFSAGPGGVLWGLPGVGAIATQAFSQRDYGPIGLAMLETGRTPEDVVPSLVAFDSLREVRQVGVIDFHHDPSAFTGGDCIPEAGHAFGTDCSAQANMMARPGVPRAMVEAFEATGGDLVSRLLAALDAAQALGGDFRGMQSAGIVVYGGERGAPEWTSRLVHLKIDDHPAPLDELRRLCDLTRLYRRWGEPFQRLKDGAPDEAVTVARELTKRMPDKVEPRIHLAISLVAAGQPDEARELIRDAVAREPRWLMYLDRIIAIAGVDVDPTTFRALL